MDDADNNDCSPSTQQPDTPDHRSGDDGDCLRAVVYAPSSSATVPPLPRPSALNRLHLWQKDPLCFVAPPAAEPAFEKSHGAHCCYVTVATAECRFGDCIADEWLSVHMLLELSRANPDLAISVVDADGEFLLIECAEHLPSWLEPESAVNRVFLCAGLLHIITPESCPSAPPTLDDALRVLWKNNNNINNPEITSAMTHTDASRLPKTAAPQAAQQALAARAAEAVTEAGARHHANCLLPLCVAHALRLVPQLLAPVVAAVYARDAESLQQCQRRIPNLFRKANTGTNRNSITNSSDKLEPAVTKTRIKFTRCLYAQLRMLNLSALPLPACLPVFCPAYAQLDTAWPCPSSAAKGKQSGSIAVQSAADLGAKLVCGYAILLTDPLFGDALWRHDDNRTKGDVTVGPGSSLPLPPPSSPPHPPVCRTVQQVAEEALAIARTQIGTEGLDLGAIDDDETAWMVLDERDVARQCGEYAKVLDGSEDATAASCTIGDAATALERFVKSKSGFHGIGDNVDNDPQDIPDGSHMKKKEEEAEDSLFDADRLFEMLGIGDGNEQNHEGDSDSEDYEYDDDDESGGTNGSLGMDKDAIASLLKSLEAEEGGGGPLRTMLADLGVFVPPPGNEIDSDGESETEIGGGNEYGRYRKL